ncbi:uncharacterized protein LOC119741255 [Patiria miniata]|uniref:Uncharacterized protein n=1 Tax=Patiria miniata TaxID=46514 RepID=A0A914BA12_PATMI|nr:uncharacterized protein LOC119741255 [Patiria miniata]
MEIYNFRSTKQKEGQILDEYVTELRTLSKTCELTDADKEILTKLIQHCSSNRLRHRALREPDKTLTQIIDMGRTLEIADQQASTKERETVHTLTRKYNDTKTKRPPAKTASRASGPKRSTQPNQTAAHQARCKLCIYCGGSYPHTGTCPAKGQTCNYCGKLNHFQRACIKRKKDTAVHNIQVSEDDYCYTLHNNEHTVYTLSLPTAQVRVNNREIIILLDTGSTVNILDERGYASGGSPPMKRRGQSQVHAYGEA